MFMLKSIQNPPRGAQDLRTKGTGWERPLIIDRKETTYEARALKSWMPKGGELYRTIGTGDRPLYDRIDRGAPLTEGHRKGRLRAG